MMKPKRDNLRKLSSNTTRDFLFQMPEDVSQRSSVVKVPELDSKNLIDEHVKRAF
jgi:hypothetical protein